MSAEFEQIIGTRGMLVKLGLSQPASRAFVVGCVAGGVAYALGLPKAAFRDDGSMRPSKVISVDPESTYTHFLLVPLIAATAGYLFT